VGRRSTGGVEAREASIRLRFTWNGQRQVEKLELAGTPANIKAANRLLEDVKAAIAARVYDRSNFGFAPRKESAPPPEEAAPIIEEAVKETFAHRADLWLRTKTGAKSTLKLDGHGVRFWKAALADKATADVLPSDLKVIIKAKVETGVTGKTVNNLQSVIRGIFESAEDDGIIATSPAGKLKSQKYQKPPPDPFTGDEMEAILAYITERYPEQVLNYFEFAFLTGLRPSELIALLWSDIDWNERTVTVRRALVLGEVKTTKTDRVREVDLSDRVIAALARQKAHTFLKGADHPIFEHPEIGRPWHDERAQRDTYFQPTLKALGMRGRDTYNTRHTFATMLLMGGVNPAYISSQLGHTTVALLFSTYSKWINKADKGVQAKAANAILAHNWPTKAAGG
jgi:integrase